MTRIAILGDGKMGQLVAALARRGGHDSVVAHVGPAETCSRSRGSDSGIPRW
jgi:3-hydroxyisobutyrate dehydrogenase-like beta-hydroxyacid dehydrogenase